MTKGKECFCCKFNVEFVIIQSLSYQCVTMSWEWLLSYSYVFQFECKPVCTIVWLLFHVEGNSEYEYFQISVFCLHSFIIEDHCSKVQKDIALVNVRCYPSKNYKHQQRVNTLEKDNNILVKVHNYDTIWTKNVIFYE